MKKCKLYYHINSLNEIEFDSFLMILSLSLELKKKHRLKKNIH